MKSRVAGLAAALSAAGLLSGRAQEPAGQPQTPMFRTAATLIEFTVVAVDAKGHPVTDLKQDDLSVADNGKPRPIAFFRFEGETPGRMDTISAAGPLGPGIFTNRSEYTPGPPRNITAIVIDSLNTRPQDQAAVRAQVMRYLRDLPPKTRVALYRTGDSVKVLHDFTDDLASLRAKVALLSIEEYSRPQAEVDVEKGRDTIK